MKTKTQELEMKNDLIRFLEELGIAWRYVINGFVGGLIWSIYRKSRFFEAVRQILVGAIVSGYITPLVVEHAGIKDHVSLIASTSFAIGMTGMAIVDGTYKYISDKIKKYREIAQLLKGKHKHVSLKNQDDDTSNEGHST